MKKNVSAIFALSLLLGLIVLSVPAQSTIEYPNAKVVDQVDDYFGTKVSDPYRWLEDPSSNDTKGWIAAQNRITGAYLDTIPERSRLRARLTELWNYEKYSAPFREGNNYFYYKNDGLQNQSVLYLASGLTDTGRVLLNPNTLSKDGTVALSGVAISPDGKTMAYGISKAGSDWREYHFRDIKTGKDLTDILKNIKFSGVSWTRDGKGVFYSRYPPPNETTKLEDANFNRKLYFHKLGERQSKDSLIYERPDDPKLGINGFVTDDGGWLIIYLSQGTSSKDQGGRI